MRARKKYFLQRNQQYYFHVLFNVHPESMSKIDYRYFGIGGMSLASPDVTALMEEISGLKQTIKTFLSDLDHIGGRKLSYLLFSRSEENLSRFFGFLALLRPSEMFMWLEFETQPPYAKELEPKARNILGTFAEWEKIFHLYDRVDNNTFYLTQGDLRFANTLLKDFNQLVTKNKSFPALLGLYQRAYGEKKIYFKHLLLLMIIESLIEGSGKDNITYKLRRLCASVIGTNQFQCQRIFDVAGKAYDLRSDLVHKAKFSIEPQMLLFVHSMVCELLLFMLVSGIEKKDLFNQSTMLGYGQRNTLVKQKKYRREPLQGNFLNLFNSDLLKKPPKKKP